MDDVQKGEWEARVLIKDKKMAKTYLVNIDFVSVRPDQLRMDIAVPLGMAVASVAMDHGQINYVIMRKREYYQGPANARSFLPVLNLALDPNLIFNVLYDEPIASKNWVCKSKDDFVSECRRLQDPIKITWAHRKAKEKNVTISHRDFEVEMEFHTFSVPKSVKPEIFTIAQPPGFRKL
jgi:hypothetical protein